MTTDERSTRPRLKWRTLDDHYATTTAEGWEYRVRPIYGGFTSVRITEGGAEAFVWSCYSLAQAKFSVFSDVRARRALAPSTPTRG